MGTAEPVCFAARCTVAGQTDSGYQVEEMTLVEFADLTFVSRAALL
jgi:hypothetical protein